MKSIPKIIPVDSPRLINQCIELPFLLYKNDPNWVPPLRSQIKKVFAGRTAFFERAEMALFLAVRGEEPVGRIAAIHNRAHNEYYKDRTGFFGFFECKPDDRESAQELLKTAEDWLRQRGLQTARGPVNPSMHSECGLLIWGFDSPPMALMPYNPPQYAEMLESAGYRKCKDLLALIVKAERVKEGTPYYERLMKLSEIIKRRYPEIRLRTINMKKYYDEVKKFMSVFEEARKNNWGYVPVTESELMEVASGLKMVIDPDLVVVAEVKDTPAAVGLAIPNINRGLIAAGGRLFPFGIFKFIRAMRNQNEMRVFGVATLPEYRIKGLTALIFGEIVLRGLRKGYKIGEASWILEDNLMSARTITDALSAEHYKTYRIYEKLIHQ
jgi:GNAT superfamily N-acetyltransferase